MQSYKFGNKITCIVRAYCAGEIGADVMQYDNQPYTILKDIEGAINFASVDRSAKHMDNTFLTYNHNLISEVHLDNVVLNDKILNMVFNKNNEGYYHKIENYLSDDTTIYLHTQGTLYNVFIYDDNGELEAYYNTYDANTITVEKANSSYLLVYAYKTDISYNLAQPNNTYYTLDLIIEGNVDENTHNMFIHIEKCGLNVHDNLTFDYNSNAIDLVFKVIATNKDYITIE